MSEAAVNLVDALRFAGYRGRVAIRPRREQRCLEDRGLATRLSTVAIPVGWG